MSKSHEHFMRRAIELACEGMNEGSGGPFGSVVVLDGKIIGEGNNRVTSTNHPTAHAEVVAIREACRTIGNFDLTGAVVYASCEPCPMCLAAIYWSRPNGYISPATAMTPQEQALTTHTSMMSFPSKRKRAAVPTEQFLRDESVAVFDEWIEKADKVKY